MPQKLHHIVPVDLVVVLEVGGDGDGEFVGEGNVPQKLHHIVPVYQSVQVDIAGDVGHDLHIKGHCLATVSDGDGLGTQPVGGEAFCCKSAGDHLAGAVGVKQLQCQAFSVQGVTL